MGLRYLGNIIKPGYNPLASNITSGVNTVQYQGVFTPQQQEQALLQQQWVTDPVFKNTSLLLQADGFANGSQNNTFLDSSSNNFAITRNGNTTQGTFSPFSQQPGAWSNVFDGSGDYITAPANAAFNLGTGDFTIECWVNTTAYNTTTYPCVLSAGAGWATKIWQLNFSTSGYAGKFTWQAYDVSSAGVFLASTNIFPLNTWNHVAVTRSGTTFRLFVNGNLEATNTSSASVTDGSLTNYIGGFDVNGWFNGSISNVRIIKGAAAYTSNFVPSTSPLGVYGSGTTSLLTCQSNRFIDNGNGNAGAGFTLTPNGNVAAQPFSPFAPQYQYTPTVTGGSGYFDGTGDYLTSTITAISNTTMTMECWIYNLSLDNTSGNHYVQVDYTGGNTNYLLSHNTNGSVRFLSRNNSGGAIFDLTSANNVLKVNQWQHIVGVRTASNASLFVDGVRVATTASPTTSSTDGTSLYVSSNGGTGRMITGWASSVRIVSGTAVYDPTLTTLTVPTAPLTAITNTKILLNFTNAGIYDGTLKNCLETVGNAQVSTSVVKYGSGSMYFDGTGDALSLPASPNLAFYAGDFTVEMWVYGSLSSNSALVGGSWPRLFTLGTAQGTGCLEVYMASGTSLIVNITTTSVITSTLSNLLNSTWNHYAVTRANGVVRAFLNGVQVGSATNADSLLLAATTTSWVGGISSSAGNFNGYMDDFRITKGIARYVRNFTPPTVALPRQ